MANVPCKQPRTNSTPLAPAQPSPAVARVAGRSFIALNSLTTLTTLTGYLHVFTQTSTTLIAYTHSPHVRVAMESSVGRALAEGRRAALSSPIMTPSFRVAWRNQRGSSRLAPIRCVYRGAHLRT